MMTGEDDDSNSIVDRIVFMEPNVSFVDTYSLHRTLRVVDSLFAKAANEAAKVKIKEFENKTAEEGVNMIMASLFSDLQTSEFKKACDSLKHGYKFFKPLAG